MSQADQAATSQPPPGQQPVVVKKYANRRLYNTETSSYITLDNLAEMIRAGRDFVVYDAKTSEDITRSVLTQIIVEEESKGSAMLPTTFLRQLIGFYGDSLQGVVPRYLEQAMTTFAHQQQQMRAAMSPFLPPGFEQIGRQNMQMIERALGLFNPFLRTGTGAPAASPNGAEQADASPSEAPALPAPETPHPRHAENEAELAALRAEVESLRTQLAEARAEAVMHQATAATGAPEAVIEAATEVVLPEAAPIPTPKSAPRSGKGKFAVPRGAQPEG